MNIEVPNSVVKLDPGSGVKRPSLGAVWISEEVLGIVETLAGLTGRSRSQLCQDAIQEYVSRSRFDTREETPPSDPLTSRAA
jgi:hypothetical protein